MDHIKFDKSETYTNAPPRSRPVRRLLVMTIFLVSLLAACSLLALEATEPFGEPDACISCHEMSPVHERWSKSSHHDNPSGVKVACIACHLPPREDTFPHLASKTHKGASHAWTHFFGKFDEKKSRKLVLDTLENKRCAHCHNNLTVKPSTPAVGAVHATALKLPDNRTYACVSCHFSLHSKKPKPPEKKFYDQADNSFCYVCHINFKKEPFVLQHRLANIACYDCHGESLPHADDEDNATAPAIMFTKDMVNDSCAKCHKPAKMKKVTSHKSWYALTDSERTQTKRQYCTDCHGMHRLPTRDRMWDKKTRKLIWREGHPVDPNEEPETKPFEESM
ncbi:MAG: NapC/NirT family cytochrome c [Phycisphaerae bacterium]|nr:NapC/NirT family cytochrome c [Planctomycetota bacterium]MBL7219003.1 NapC/NirT family cytochrome c [Phycisphaerae bacterium]